MMVDVLIVGAGPAGLGVALELRRKGIENLHIVDRKGVGATFEAWPRETKFITPSFPGHAYGCPDLNAIDSELSPGALLGVDHPSGIQYAEYLREVVNRHRLSIEHPVCVESLQPVEDYWIANTSTGILKSRCMIWATGEFGSPSLEHIPGLNACDHYADIRSWKEVAGKNVLILGGGESGIDAACNLIRLGKTVSVLDRSGPWEDTDADPSWTLSPVSRERLREALSTNRLRLEAGIDITRVEATSSGYCVFDRDGFRYVTDSLPINCLGFEGGASRIRDLWEWKGDHPQLTDHDESTRHPGLFLAGPQVRQPGEIFCFIYKFRTRFPLVAEAIRQRLYTNTSSTPS